MWSNSRNLLRSFVRPSFIYLFFATMSLILLFSSLFYWFEIGENSKLQSGLDALYFSVATLTSVGFGDIAPVTQKGKILTIIMMLVGSAIYVSFTAVVATTILELDWEQGKDS